MVPWQQPNLVWNSCKNWDQNKKQGLALCSPTESLSFGSTSADKKRPNPHTAARNGVQKKHFDRKLKIVHITRISQFEASNLTQRLPSMYVLRKYMSELGLWIVDSIYYKQWFQTKKHSCKIINETSRFLSELFRKLQCIEVCSCGLEEI